VAKAIGEPHLTWPQLILNSYQTIKQMKIAFKRHINLRFWGGALFVGYMFFIAGRMAYKNYQIEQQISDLAKEVVAIEEENQDLRASIIYYQSDNFKEREARLKLGLQKPGETVIVIPSQEPFAEEKEEEKKKESNFSKWKVFLFKG